jgi:hypothetical protein
MILPLILLPFISFIPQHDLTWSLSLYYTIPTTAIATYIFLLNFPKLVHIFHSKPLYFNDLEDNRYAEPGIQKRFQFIFIAILQFTLTISITSMIYYYHDSFHNTNLTKMELFGVLGGFYSLLLKIENKIGNIVLYLLNKWKESTPIMERSISCRPRSLSFAVVAEV